MGNHLKTKKIQMKTAILAAAVASVEAVKWKCNPAKMHAKIWSDQNCKKLNVAATRKWGRIPKKHHKWFSGKCEVRRGKYGQMIRCSPKGFAMAVWKNTKCSGKPAWAWGTPWDKCHKAGRGSVSIHTTQKNFAAALY